MSEAEELYKIMVLSVVSTVYYAVQTRQSHLWKFLGKSKQLKGFECSPVLCEAFLLSSSLGRCCPRHWTLDIYGGLAQYMLWVRPPGKVLKERLGKVVDFQIPPF